MSKVMTIDDLFKIDKLAVDFCTAYGYEKWSKEYTVAANAFCVGYRLGSQQQDNEPQPDLSCMGEPQPEEQKDVRVFEWVGSSPELMCLVKFYGERSQSKITYNGKLIHSPTYNLSKTKQSSCWRETTAAAWDERLAEIEAAKEAQP